MSDWNDLHHKTTVVDLHTHPVLKSTIFHWNLSSPPGKFLQRFFKEKIWKKQKQYKQENKINIEMKEEEIVEAAGLDEEIELTDKSKEDKKLSALIAFCETENG